MWQMWQAMTGGGDTQDLAYPMWERETQWFTLSLRLLLPGEQREGGWDEHSGPGDGL